MVFLTTSMTFFGSLNIRLIYIIRRKIVMLSFIFIFISIPFINLVFVFFG